MINRNTVQRVWTMTFAALALSALALGPALAQAAKTCSHEGKTYQAGEKLTISGKAMVCDGATGSWVPSKV